LTTASRSVSQYLRGKTILLTGGTGFLGKVIVERLLCAAPEIERIYLLIRTQRQPDALPTSALTRFETEVLASPVFAALAQAHGPRWGAFAREKIAPIAGDVSLPRLGLHDDNHSTLTSRVDIMINAAASVAFDAPIDEALLHNTRSVEHVAEFARACHSAVLVQVSTAFVAGCQTGRILETALTPNIAAGEAEAIDEIVRALRAEARHRHWDERHTRARLIEAGMTRARGLGWHDSYTYTKALGEMTLARRRGDVPTAIIRPSIIESSLRDPAPGWLENLNVGDPLFVEFGRGRMPEFPLGLDTIFDIVPVDLVANAVVAVLPRVAAMQRDIGYFTIGSGSLNPLTGAHLYDLTYDYFRRRPMHDRRGRAIVPPVWTFPTPERFREMFGGQARRSATTNRLLYLADLYEGYTNVGCVFDTTNTQRLLEDLHDDDRTALDFDVRHIAWRSYIQDVHIPGLQRHVLRERAPARTEAVGLG
jgi:nucleoside-diphosphate-sugar epimerase